MPPEPHAPPEAPAPLAPPDPASGTEPGGPGAAGTGPGAGDHGTWSDLVSVALVGTARRSVPRLAGLPGADRGDPTATLLDRAALATVRRRAGRTPEHIGTDSPAILEPAAAETAPLPGPRAAQRLDSLRTANSEHLAEWLELAGRHGLRVPPETLPDLLDRGSRDHDGIGRPLAAAAGARGLWLAGLNPKWSYLARMAGTAEFTAEQWRSEPAEKRYSLLEARGAHLTEADKPLIDEALTDRSTRVRGLAMALAARFPDTERGRRLSDLARRHVLIGADGSLQLCLPDLADPDLARDLGVSPRKQDKTSRNTRRERLWVLVHYTPLGAWVGHLGADPAEVARNAGGDHEFFEALADAAVLQYAPAWARALLPVALQRLSESPSDHSTRARPLLGVLPPAEQCSLALEHLEQVGARQAHYPGRVLLPIVQVLDCAWDEAFSRMALRILGAVSSPNDLVWPICSYAENRMSPALHFEVTAAARGATSNKIQARLEGLADTLKYRHEMHQEFR
ncbi:DUF5691 domain-containing protein [Streptomonospora sediminis]